VLEKFDPMADDRTPDQKRGTKRLVDIPMAETPYHPYQELLGYGWTRTTWAPTTISTSGNTYTNTYPDGSTYTYTLDEYGSARLTSATFYGGGNGIV
jgi:hypothetical protein